MTEAASINGWTPPVVYDVSNDKHRTATQADIDEMETTIRVLGAFYRDTKMAVELVGRSRQTAKSGENP